MNKILKFILCCILIMCLFGCTSNGNESSSDNSTSDSSIKKLSFKEMSSYDELKAMNGEQIQISGYLATSSPVDGSFIFLMNLPYQNCPFCKPNTSQLSNTLEVYPKKGKTFSYTNSAVKVTGTLVVAENEDQPFTDDYGYEFNFKITDGEYVIIKDSELSDQMKLWQAIASADIVSDIYKMYDYLSFVCFWPTYYVNSYYDEEGNLVPGYYLYASDATYFITTDNAQWNYGYKDSFYEGIIKDIEKIDPEAFTTLTDNVKKVQEFAKEAYKEITDGNYTYEYKYVEDFGKYDYVYTLDNAHELETKFYELYYEFTDWLGSWEL